MKEVALIIIYNHQYNQNIDVVESIYKKRFSHIFHLVPFYRGDKPNVIPVYENSFYFQGYVAQGFHRFFRENFRHYIFIGDDLMLNPQINENNYSTTFKLKAASCFVPDPILLHDVKEKWQRQVDGFHYWIHVKGVEAAGKIPSYDEAIGIFRQHKLEIQPLSFDQAYVKEVLPGRFKIKDLFKYATYKLRSLKNKSRPYDLSYPLVGSYADIFVVSAGVLPLFCHYCGVFAATDLHAELAIPTAMILSAKHIVTEKDLDLSGKALWTEKDYEIMKPYANNLNLLLENFPSNHLFLHPVKLSKWNYQQHPAL